MHPLMLRTGDIETVDKARRRIASSPFAETFARLKDPDMELSTDPGSRDK